MGMNANANANATRTATDANDSCLFSTFCRTSFQL